MSFLLKSQSHPPSHQSMASSHSFSKERLLRSYTKPYRLRFILSTLSVLGAAGLVLAFGRMIKNLVDKGSFFHYTASIELTLAGVFLSILILAIFSFGRVYYSAWLSERITSDIRRDLFHHMQSLDVSYYDEQHPSDLTARLTTDLTLIQMVGGIVFPTMLRNIALLIGSFTMMIVTSLKLTALSLVLVPIIVCVGFIFGRKVRVLSKETQQTIGNLSAFVEEILTNIRTCFAFNHEKDDAIKFHTINETSFQMAAARAFSKARLSSFVMTVAFAGICGLVYIGLLDIKKHLLTAGDLSSFLFYALLVAGTAGSFAENFADIKKASGAADRLMDVFKIQSTLPKPISKIRSHIPCRGTLAIHNVDFSYITQHAVQRPKTLEKINFTINPGERVAIVGPSGAGKTTIFSLLMRFYQPQSGSIYIDGFDYNDLHPQDIRSKIALVPQDPALFSTSLLDNILYGNPNATPHALQEAIRIARLEELIDKLPNGEHTMVGIRGVKLSGGQKQRIAIARAILKNPTLFLLDEATSALDAENEKAVQDGLNYLMNTRSSLVIAHRLSTVLHAERIIVLNHGRIEGMGSHAELCETNPLYRRLATLQFIETRNKLSPYP